MTTQTLIRDVETRLKARSIRFTKGRRAVVRALSAGEGPKSAAELHDAIGSEVPLSSLYRSLAVLEDAGVVIPHFGSKSLTRYELAEWLTGHHHHLVCIDCGAVDDIDVPAEQEEEVRRAVEGISAYASFAPRGHVLEIEGRCARCA